MKKIIIILGIIILVLIVIFSLRFIIGGSEDDWICTNGEWVKHGSPSAPMPSKSCDKGKLIDEERDEYGCLISSKFHWCPSTKKCQKMREEYCEEFKELYEEPFEVGAECTSFKPEECPNDCTVCPPCLECSSISCQNEKICKELGFGKNWYKNINKKISDFNECAEAGYPIMESYPQKCRAGEETFTENIGNELEKQDLIKLNNPRPNQVIESPLLIEGEARGYWFFEGDFPVVLTNWDGLIIAEGYATAEGEWMTENFVKFKAKIEYDQEKIGLYNNGSLILKKDNPSGLPENDDALEIPIKFKK